VTGVSGVVFCRGSRSGGKVHLWMRGLVSGADLLRLPLGWMSGRAVRVLSSCCCRSILVPLRMLRVRLVERGDSAHRWDDGRRRRRLRVVVLFPLLLLTMIGHVHGRM
jgi:hypothetical protein